MDGNFQRQDFAQGTGILETTEFRQESRTIQAADQLDQQRFGAADGHARDDEHHPQGAAVVQIGQTFTAKQHRRPLQFSHRTVVARGGLHSPLGTGDAVLEPSRVDLSRIGGEPVLQA